MQSMVVLAREGYGALTSTSAIFTIDLHPDDVAELRDTVRPHGERRRR